MVVDEDELVGCVSDDVVDVGFVVVDVGAGSVAGAAVVVVVLVVGDVSSAYAASGTPPTKSADIPTNTND